MFIDFEKIVNNDNLEDMYVLCATPKHGYAFNSLLFWGKNNCGYYPNLNECEFYTKDEVLKRANDKNIPIKVSDLIDYLAVHVEHAESLLDKAEREYKNGEI